MRFGELARPPAVEVVGYFVVFSRCRGVDGDEEDGLVSVEAEKAVVGECSKVDEAFED